MSVCGCSPVGGMSPLDRKDGSDDRVDEQHQARADQQGPQPVGAALQPGSAVGIQYPDRRQARQDADRHVDEKDRLPAGGWVRTPPSTRAMEAPAAPARLNALPVTPLEQVLCSCLEALGAEQFEAEGIGEPVGRVERGADRQRVLDLLA